VEGRNAIFCGDDDDDEGEKALVVPWERRSVRRAMIFIVPVNIDCCGGICNVTMCAVR